MRVLTGGESSPNGIIGLDFVLERSVNEDATTGIAPATKSVAEKRGCMFERVPGGQPIPQKVWMRASDVAAEYARCGEAFVSAGRPVVGLVTDRFVIANAEYNQMADAIWFAKWTEEQRDEWSRIFR